MIVIKMWWSHTEVHDDLFEITLRYERSVDKKDLDHYKLTNDNSLKLKPHDY